ncbi:uncharacterized protein EV154DRAFT_578343 [Mucor mucedo]|uniref:uncharacterized protein n=1 Tax=Mucor mucedo TaxID=29922 RepID=UPI002220DA2A|nr:uncharacterized protein EV154DRAFT_578343 [Mucor mucedo]KAI7874438.1 hypothetical protein EV154DRAFT_578343 [Mucor mucedo]
MAPNISKAHKKPKQQLYMYITDDYIKQQEEEELKQKEKLTHQLYGKNCYLEGPLPVTEDDDELNHEKAFRSDDHDCDMNSPGGGDDDHGAWNDHDDFFAATIQPVITQPVTTQAVSTEPVVNLTQHRIKLQKLSAAWKDLMKVFPNAYLAFLAHNGGLPNMLDGQGCLRSPSCGCPDDYMRLAKVNFFFVWVILIRSFKGVKNSEGFFYCSHCNTLPVALVESGFFPLSPNRTTGAVHFSLCDFFLRLRNTFAGSAEKISSFYDAWAPGTEKTTISEEKCSNTILLYHKMVELSEQMVLGEVSTSCPACPEVGSTNVNDKQFMTMDGNFHLRGTRLLADEGDLSKVSGLGKFKNFWMNEDLVQSFDKSEKVIDSY